MAVPRGARTAALMHLERSLWKEGLTRVAGVDEAGVGPLAGPVVAAAVIFPPGTVIPGVDDSKRLTARQRAAAAEAVRRRALGWSVGVVEPEEIDRLNIYHASLEAMRRALDALSPAPEIVLADGRVPRGLDIPVRAIVGGDRSVHVIAAASILAKTYRDACMADYDAIYPGYGFAEHKGYATRRHREAIRRLGPCPIHRRSFRWFPQPRLW